MGGCNAFQFIDCNDAILVFLPLSFSCLFIAGDGEVPCVEHTSVMSISFRGHSIN
jgi:hypothetical protein